MKPKHQRLTFVAVSMVFLCLAVLFTMRAFKENLIYFYSPSQVAVASIPPGQTIRLGGLVETGSLEHKGNSVHFLITDGTQSYEVHYTGLLPNLFREGQGVVAEGSFATEGVFSAQRILAKHDEKYMPPEVVDALKKSGRWREGER
jgi:cytochrome c-type biogenesis protein CcmE